jgi:tol-pal system protein YbgF
MRPFWAAGIAALLTCFIAGAAIAQSDTRELRIQIDNLQNQIVGLRAQVTDLERQVYSGTAPPRSTSGSAAAPSDGASGRMRQRLAVVETDIDQIGEWQRRVTGRFDELENMIRRVEGRIERLVADVDFRLSALEQQSGQPSAAGNAPLASSGDGGAAESTALSGQGNGSVAAEAGSGYKPSGAPQSLGTIPADQSVGVGADPSDQVAALQTAGTPEEQYDLAFKLLGDGRWADADRAFSQFIDSYPEHERAENASYWRGESLYVREMYVDAARTYALNLQRFPDGPKRPDNMVKLGMALVRLGKVEEACQTFNQLDQDHPDMPTNIRQAAKLGRSDANCP